MKARHLGMIAISVASIFLASCNQESGISDQQVSDYIKIQIPPYLTVKSVTLQRLTAASLGVSVVQTYNFKLAGAPEEPLFVPASFDSIPERDLISKGFKETSASNQLFQSGRNDFKGLDQIQYLKQVNQPSETITIYGTVGARKMVESGGVKIG